MLTDREKTYARDLLLLIAVDDLYSLVATATNNLVQPCTVEEATDCILQHTATLESLLSRKKVSRDVLFQYLHYKKVDVDASSDKKALVSKVLQLWRVNSPETLSTLCKKPLSLEDTRVPQVHELALKFSEWFYQMLNCSASGGLATGPGVEHFWPNCSLILKMESPAGCEEHVVRESSVEVAQLLRETCTRHGLLLNPNLMGDGVWGQADAHGLVTVVACGTLHAGGMCVGVFEQAFGLIRDPRASNNWKIKTMDLRMRATSVSSLPTIQTGVLFNNLCMTK